MRPPRLALGAGATAPVKIALLGAESTGKTTLAARLATALRDDGHAVAVVPELLREWCEREGRMPRPDEHFPIAQDQERRVESAAAAAQVVIADTTALMVAIWGGLLFDGDPLLTFALERQRAYDLTLVTGLDVPWVADGLHRDPAQPREQVDALVRELLARAGVSYRVVYGTGEERLRNALAALPEGLAQRPAPPPARPGWQWTCGECSDPDCEHRLFTSLARR